MCRTRGLGSRKKISRSTNFLNLAIGGAVFYVVSGFYSGRVLMVAVAGMCSEDVMVYSDLQDSVLGLLCFLLYTTDL